MKKKKRTRNIIISSLFLALNIVVVVFIARNIFAETPDEGLGSIVTLWGRYWYFIVVAFLCTIVALLAEGMKFFVMVGKKLKGRRLRVSLKTAVFGKYYDNVTPLGTGGQPFQIMYLYQYGISGPDSSLLPVASFVMNQIAFTLIAVVVFITGSHLVTVDFLRISAYVGLFFMMAMPIVVLLFTLFPVISRKLSVGILKLLHRFKLVKSVDERIQKIDYFIVRFKTSFKQMSKSRRILVVTFLLSIVYHIAIFSIPFFVVKGLGMDVNYIELFALCVFVYSAISYVPTPGNSGGAEVSFAFIFTMLAGSQLFWSMLMWRFASYYAILMLGLLTLLGDFIAHQKKPVIVSEKERHKVVYPLMTLKDSKNLIFPDIEKGEL